MEKKQSVLAILDILTSYSDENNILSTNDIIKYLKDIYSLNIERRTIYSNIDLLMEYGYEISRYEDNGKGYFLEEKQFTKGEILLLCNAIHASHFITDKQSNILINKLLKTLSKEEAKEFKGNVYMPNNLKSLDSDLIYNIETISEAIRDKKCLKFDYMKYDENKKLIKRREDPYIVEPRYIVYADSRPYMIATNKKYYDYTHYRIDRMAKTYILEDKIKTIKNGDAYEYAKNKLFMYNGELNTIVFKCKEDILDQIIDIFGTDIKLSFNDDKTFTFRVKTSNIGAKYLAQQYLEYLEILVPTELRNEFKKELQNNIKKYK